VAVVRKPSAKKAFAKIAFGKRACVKNAFVKRMTSCQQDNVASAKVLFALEKRKKRALLPSTGRKEIFEELDVLKQIMYIINSRFRALKKPATTGVCFESESTTRISLHSSVLLTHS
jgi:hypothetical protein